MNSWNSAFILVGIVMIIGTMIRDLTKHKINFHSEKYFRKLELKYGGIDRERAIKLDKLCNYLLGLEYIIIGLLIRAIVVSIIVLIAISVIMILGYYLIRKKYIAI